jgi:hypothetical protein
MKGNPFKYLIMVVFSAIFLVIPSVTLAVVEQRSTGPPPIEQQLIREGELAVKLATALGVGVVADEAEAESRLAELGITPKSGWIADYPVTPDISGELRNAVAAAAESGKLSMDRDVAIKLFDDVLAGLGLPLAPYSGDVAYDIPPPATETYYQDPSVVYNYYDTVGPPVVTYYTPPPTYYDLYAWVPYPFWVSGFLFPGFFVLHDFHRTVFVHHHKKVFVTNHFRDRKTHRIHRVDSVARFKGESFVSKRGHDSRTFRSGRGLSSDRRFSDGQRTRTFRERNAIRQRTSDNRALSLPTERSGRDFRQQFDRTRSFTTSSPNVRSFNRSSGVSGRSDQQSFDRIRNFTTSSPNVRSFNRGSGVSGRGGGQSFDRIRNFSPSSQGTRSFSRPSTGSGSTNLRSGGSRSFSSGMRGGGYSHGGRGRR